MILPRAGVAAARSSAGRRGALYHGQDWPASMLGDRHQIRDVISRRLLSREIQIELVLEYPFRKVPQTQEGVFHSPAEQAAAQEVVVQRDAQVVDQMRASCAVEEIHVVPPAGKEKLPLQVGEPVKFRALVFLQARIFQWHK